MLSCVRLFQSPWTVARQAPLSMDCPGKITGVGCHFLRESSQPWVEPMSLVSPAWQANYLPLNHLESIVYVQIILSRSLPVKEEGE